MKITRTINGQEIAIELRKMIKDETPIGTTHKLKNGSGQSGAVRYIRNKSTNGTFYFEQI